MDATVPLLEIQELFHQVVSLPSEARADFLGHACGQDSQRRAALERLLRHDELAERQRFLAEPPSESPSRDDLLGRRIGSYQICEVVGQGGMGVVYRAERIVDYRQEVAVKVIVAGAASDEWLARFRAERQALAALDHPNIARLLDGGTVDGRPYLVMEYVRGERIDYFCERNSLDAAARAGLLLEACGAVAHAHQRGVLHRDLKPANLLVTVDGRVRLLDFGLARRLGAEDTVVPTHPGAILGTPSYMAPEQGRGEASPLSDVYGLGAVLYELLTGRPPFRGETPWQTLRQVQEEEPLPPSRLTRGLPRDLETICLTCLQKSPARRYRDVPSLIDDLQRFRTGLPIAARPPGFREHLIRSVRRHPAMAVALVLGIFIALAAIMGWEAHHKRLRQERIQALVQQLAAAETDHVTSLLDELAALGQEPEHHLRSVVSDAAPSSQRSLRARLALLPLDPQQVEPLVDHLDLISPKEIAIICERLQPFAERVIPQLNRVIDAAETDPERRFHATCVLASVAPKAEIWSSLAPPLVDQVLTTPMIDLHDWVRLLHPIRLHLREPLRAAFVKEAQSDRSAVAAAVTAALVHDDAPALLEQALQATPSQLAQLIPSLMPHAETLTPHLEARLHHPLPQPDMRACDWGSDELAPVWAIRARAALLLLHFGDHEPAWQFLRASPDPQGRTYLTLWLASTRFPISRILDRFRRENDLSVRRALLHALGDYAPSWLSPAERTVLTRELRMLHASHSDPGLHSSTDWLLRRWGLGLPESQPLATSVPWSLGSDVRWHEGPQGHTFVLFPGPVTARLGTPPWEFDRSLSEGGEPPRTQHLAWSFAIATKETTVRQMRQHNPQFIGCSSPQCPLPDCPVTHLTWLEAIEYCRWLTTSLGLTEADQCYPSTAVIDKLGFRIYPDALKRRGFRLPTENEWEHACRAGTRSSRHWGDDRLLASRFAWTIHSSEFRTTAIAERPPNEFGCFDMLGNAWEWCHEPFDSLRFGPVEQRNPDWGGPLHDPRKHSPLRGGAFTYRDQDARAARRRGHYINLPAYGDFGFRIARTVAVPADTWNVRFFPRQANAMPAYPDEEEWARLLASPCLREVPLADLSFAFLHGQADEGFVFSAERIFSRPGGRYKIRLKADDGVRFKVDGRAITPKWIDSGEVYERTLELKSGCHLTVEYVQRGGAAALEFGLHPVTDGPK